jgi:hypothetical protein
MYSYVSLPDGIDGMCRKIFPSLNILEETSWISSANMEDFLWGNILEDLWPMAYETCGLNPRNDCEIHLVGWKIGDFFWEMDGNSKSFISKSFPRWENIGWLAVGRLGRTILKEADGIQFGQFMGKRICDKL